MSVDIDAEPVRIDIVGSGLDGVTLQELFDELDHLEAMTEASDPPM